MQGFLVLEDGDGPRRKLGRASAAPRVPIERRDPARHCIRDRPDRSGTGILTLPRVSPRSMAVQYYPPGNISAPADLPLGPANARISSFERLGCQGCPWPPPLCSAPWPRPRAAASGVASCAFVPAVLLQELELTQLGGLFRPPFGRRSQDRRRVYLLQVGPESEHRTGVGFGIAVPPAAGALEPRLALARSITDVSTF